MKFIEVKNKESQNWLKYLSLLIKIDWKNYNVAIFKNEKVEWNRPLFNLKVSRAWEYQLKNDEQQNTAVKTEENDITDSEADALFWI